MPAFPSHPRPELGELVRQAVEKFEALTVDQKREHRAAQRRSWVRGELRMQYPDMTVDEANALIDRCDAL